MTKNNKIELSGFLGSDAKSVNKGEKSFVVLNLATTDSYPVANEKTGEVTWKDRETIWHEIFVFRPTAISFSKDLKKGDRVEVTGTLNYKTFKDDKGYNRKQAAIIATYVEKIAYNKQEALLLDSVDDIVE